ncbi:hypothetical protein [Agrobacterium pusense]|uniref:hypothetical protein n=1 Tax=Agrobacterium pusense TaxID=648995 RepID=UPI000889F04E|nr:hypothetical protein [Agrobacterium pusense]OOO22724.1 hypothetical protein BTE56_04770 [Agrobacterium pusense]WKD45076.1 hypothetical protein M8C82_16875 [Agrobacterium pusense]SDE61676.1 hypothetical protein SAMN05421750_102535 [Agrobacterium pusense]
MTIHYHGTPLTPRSELLKMAGKHFCVSYANPGDAEWCLQNGQSVMWDNGAFTFYRGGKKTDWTKYYSWLESKLGHPHWAVVPDVIDGTVEEQRELVAQWPFPKTLSAPVWHTGLSIDYLLELAENWPRICFGSSGAYWQVGSAAWERRTDEAFNALEKRGIRPWVHMLRGLAMCGDRWPFASADSVNVARNFKDTPICPERMARRIDAVQCPFKWTLKTTTNHHRGDLFNDIAC